MNAPFIVAQAITSGQATSRTTVKLTKPANGQAVSVQLDGNTQLDFSAIAGEPITLVRVGNQLVILFDNQATLTIPLFFDAAGNPLDGIAVDLGNNRIVDGQEFAGLFPITTNQTILPASGNAGGGGDGFGAGDPNVDALNTGNPLDLLGNENFPGITFTINEVLARDNDETGAVEPAPTAFSQTVAIDEDGDAPFPIFGLPDRLPGGPGDDPTAPLIYFGGPGISGNPPSNGPAFFNFGSDGPAAVNPIIYDIAALTALNLTSGGIPIVWTQVGDNLEGRVGPAPNELVVGVTILDLTTGDFALAMLRPLDHTPPAGGIADESGALIGIPFTLTDGNGTQATGTLTVNVNDDSPEQSFGFDEELGVPLPPDSGNVEEVPGLPVSDSVSLGILWGADNFNAGGTNDRSVTFADQGTLSNNVAFTGSGPLSALTSNGVTVEYVLIGGVLVAYTGSVPGAVTDKNVVFSVELSDVLGTFTFTLRGPLDHPAPDVANPASDGTIPHFIDLTFSLTVTDSDGDGINATVTVNVDAAGDSYGCGCGFPTIDYSALPGGVFINLDDTARTELGQTVDANTATDLDGVSPQVIGRDNVDGIEHAIGTDSADVIIGGDEDNVLEGLGGADLIRGGDGMDEIYGGDGADDLRGGRGSDGIEGGEGDDTIRGGRGDDFLYGDDILGLTSGADTIYGGRGDDYIFGQGGTDTLYGGRGDDLILGGDDADTISGGRDDDEIDGEGGDDTIIYNVGDGHDLVFGGSGDDVQEIYGTGDSETFNINLITIFGDDFVGINIRDGIDVPGDVVPATPGNFELAIRDVEDIYIDTGAGPDAVVVTGSLGGTGLATSTITIDGGSDGASDAVDASGLTSNHGIVFNGGGGDDYFFLSGADGVDTFNGGTGIDTALYSCFAADATFGFDGTHWTITVNGVTDTIIGVEAVEFADESFLLVDHYGQDVGGFQTIQEAVDYSCGCQTILIAPGTYDENVTINNNDVSLMGLEPSRSTIITGEITIKGVLDGDVSLTNLAINAAGEEYGVHATASSTAFGGAITLDNVLIENAGNNGFAYIRDGNGSTPTLADTIGAISILNSEFSGNGGAAGTTRGDILIYGFNGDLAIEDVSIHDAAAGADKAIQVRGIEGPSDVLNEGPFASFGDVSLVNLTITGTYAEDLVAFYRIADFATFVAINVMLNASAPWGLFNVDEVGGGNVDLQGVTGTNGAGPFIATMQGLASGDAFAGTPGNDMFVGRGGDDILLGNGGNDTFFYSVGGGQDVVDGGTEGVGGKDLLDVTGTGATENFFIETPAEYTFRTGNAYVGSEILVSSGDDILVEASEIEDIVIHGGGGADTLTVSGSFTGTSLLTSTITYDSGEGNDTLDLRNRDSNHRVVADGGTGTDTVLYDFARSAVTSITAIRDSNNVIIGANITHNEGGQSVTDELTNFESFTFSDGIFDLTTVFNQAKALWAPNEIKFIPGGSNDDNLHLNVIRFADAGLGGIMTVTFETFVDSDGAFIATDGGGVTVSFGSGTDEMALTGTAAAINTFIADNRLVYDMDGTGGDDTIVVTIDGSGTPVFITIDDAVVSIGSNDSSSSLPGGNIFNVYATSIALDLPFTSGLDSIATAWNHLGSAATVYDGGDNTSGNDVIRLVFTTSQLNEILGDTGQQDALRTYLASPVGNDLDLSASTWNAEARNFEVADLSLAALYDIVGDAHNVALNLWDPIPTAVAIGSQTGGADLIVGNTVGQTLNGGAGDDVLAAFHNAGSTLNGESGFDLLLGGDGDDILDGGDQRDMLGGGRGADIFVLSSPDFANSDTIVDYDAIEGDRLNLSALLDANFGPGSVVSDFVRLTNSGTDINVEVDTDGAGGPAVFDTVATLVGYNGLGVDVVRAVFDNVEHTLTT